MPLIIKKPTFMNGGQVYGHPPPPPPDTLGQEYGGGYYVGTTTSLDGSSYYLIVAPNATGCACCQWKTTLSTTVGATSTVDGYANTYGPMDNTTHPAGNWTATRTIGSFSDWYFPSRDEIKTLYTNRNTVPVGERYNTGDQYYWSSTESASSPTQRALRICFCNGSFGNVTKNTLSRVRAVRRVPI